MENDYIFIETIINVNIIIIKRDNIYGKFYI